MFCVHCGKPSTEDVHAPCRGARTSLEPPRYCAECARRMVVQITPLGWTARCSRHGDLTSADPVPTA